LYKNFKIHKIKDHSDMFRIAHDPKHVGVIFNFMYFKIFIQRRF